jgi:hypothetical protein
MIIDLKKDVFFRGFAFEVFAEKFLRKQNNNSFIFRTNRFANLDVLKDYYKLDVSKVSNINLIREYYKSIDIIEFKLDDYKTKIINSIVLYEVKSKIESRKRPVDISRKGHNRFLELKKAGFETKLVFVKLLSDWKFDINIFEYNQFDNVALRKQRFLFGYKKNIYRA